MLPRVNVYLCQYNCHTVTVDVDKGVTPFMIGCRSRSTLKRPIAPELLNSDGFCKGVARSNFYPKTPKPPWIGEPQWEWYKPTPEDISKMDPIEARHYLDHPEELAMRARTDREPIYHGEA